MVDTADRPRRLLQPLREEAAKLFARAYPEATPEDAFDWRVRHVGVGETRNWGVPQYIKAIKKLKQRLGIPLRNRPQDPFAQQLRLV